MDIKIGDQPDLTTDEEIYLYALSEFAKMDEHNAKIERERREQQRLYKLEYDYAYNKEMRLIYE